jgi:hypothetical protein
MGEITQGGERNCTTFGMKGKVLSTETERATTQKVRMVRNYNVLVVAL